MEIYFIKINELLKIADKSSLETFLDGNEFLSEKRRIEYATGRFLLKFILKTKYGIDNPQILIKNKKPCISLPEPNFSLTHSHGYVMAVFDNANLGIDLELMKQRDFEKLFKHYNLNPDQRDKKTFYQLWTQYEAEIKLQQKPASVFSALFKKDYCFCVCSSADLDISSRLKIYELKSPVQSIKPKELINLKLVIDSKKNENTLVAHEISTADFEFEELEPLNLKIE